MVNMEFNARHPNIIGEGSGGAIGVWVDVTVGVAIAL